MRISKKSVEFKASRIPDLRFEDQDLTSFSGLVLFQGLFDVVKLKARLRRATSHLGRATSYTPATIVLVLIVHLLMGWRYLRDLAYYQEDPIVLRLLGLKRMPTPSTVTRGLGAFDQRTVEQLGDLSTGLVIDRIQAENLNRATLDFDGSVLSTKRRRAEGTAVGYNPGAKGARGYYPLFCTLAQTGQVLDVLHRPGNVHDSKGAAGFIHKCVGGLRKAGFSGVVEARMDAAHYNQETCRWLDDNGVEFTVSVPFMRLVELKEIVESRQRWKRIDADWSFFECNWKPKSWHRQFRIIVYRHRVAKPQKGPIQLHLFEPVDRYYEYKVVVTNKNSKAKAVLAFHNGRGSQEGVLGEMKSQLNMGYIPFRRLIPNQVFLLSAVLAHNLTRHMQTLVNGPSRRTTPTRACLWVFDKVDTFRKRLVQRAGRLTRPNGSLTLTLSGNEHTAQEMMHILRGLDKAA